LFFGSLSDVPEAGLDQLRREAARVAGSHGLDLFDLQFRRESTGWVLRVIVDRIPGSASGAPGAIGASGAGGAPGTEGATVTEEAVTIDDCRRVSEDLSALLDVNAELLPADRAYTLEVSSPGLDRPLRGQDDYQRFTGRLAKIVTRQPVDGQSHFAGRLSGLDGDVVLVAEGRRIHRVPLGLISRARLEVEF
jgi:ribosome maturation factor RimP